MNVTKEIKQIEDSAVQLTATIAKEDVASGYKASLAKYAKNIQLPGFRKGHVPTSVLERKYGESLRAEILGDLIDQALNEVLSGDDAKDFRPLPYAQPRLDQDKLPQLDLQKDLTFTVTYDVFPKVEVKEFGGITIKEPQVEISEDDLNSELKSIQERNAAVIDKNDGDPVEKDNIITIDYKELDDAGNTIAGSERQDFVFTVGSGQNLYKIDDDVIGMKKGDTKEITKTYGKDEKDSELAGTTKKLSVTVKAVKVRNLPALDDDLAQDVNEKYKTLDDLKKDIKLSMELAKKRKLAEMKSQSLLEQLVEKNPIALPKSMVAAENESRWHMLSQQFKTSPEQLEKMVSASGQTKETMLQQWAGNTEQALKSRLIVDTLLRERNIAVTPEEIEARYQTIAEENGLSLDEVKEHYSDVKAKEYLIDEAKENKLFEMLYKEVKVTKGDKMSFADLFKADSAN
ncbi:MAG TPA: trigger factor [Treponema sp.]|nr:trigger factor [Treponema sp.]